MQAVALRSHWLETRAPHAAGRTRTKTLAAPAHGSAPGAGGRAAPRGGEARPHIFLIVPAKGFVLDLAQLFAKPAVQRRPPFRRVQRTGLRLAAPEHLHQRLRGLKHAGDGVAATGAGEVVGILPVGQEGEAQAAAGAEHRQGHIDGAVRGLAAGAVAIEAQDRLLAHAPEQLALIGRERGAQGRHHVGKAGCRHGDDVHIPLHRDHRSGVMGGLAGVVVVVERRALVKERRLGRIQILGRDILFQRPPAEGDHLAGAVADREHHAIAKPVVGHGDVLAMDQQTRLAHGLDRRVPVGQPVPQRVLLIRRIAEPELRLHRRAQPAIRQIAARPRPGAPLQLLLEKLRCEFKNLLQARAALLLPLDLLGDDGQIKPRFARKSLHRLGKRQPLRAHDEVEDVAVLAGGEIEPRHFGVVHEKRRALFRCERRQPLPLPAGLQQLHAAAHHLRNRKAGLDLFEEGRGKPHSVAALAMTPLMTGCAAHVNKADTLCPLSTG